MAAYDRDYAVTNGSLILSPIPLGNDTEQLLGSLCDAFEMHNPSLILSFLEPKKSYYLKLITKKIDIPILTLSSEYKETFHLEPAKRPVSLAYHLLFRVVLSLRNLS